MDLRSTSATSTRRRRGPAAPPPSILSISASTKAHELLLGLRQPVVSEIRDRPAIPASSKPTTERSAGTSKPIVSATSIRSIAARSLDATTPNRVVAAEDLGDRIDAVQRPAPVHSDPTRRWARAERGPAQRFPIAGKPRPVLRRSSTRGVVSTRSAGDRSRRVDAP